MNGSDINKKIKRIKRKVFSNTSPEKCVPENSKKNDTLILKPLYPLLAKDSEWVDILHTSSAQSTYSDGLEEEEILQLIDGEDGLDKKPLAVLFPGLLEKDPKTLEGVLNKAMSTTEVTKHLVDLGQKANFTFMKKANRLIPCNKQWLESLTEDSQSNHSSETKTKIDGDLRNELNFCEEPNNQSTFR